ncbi:SymE family type I addiction module toxin [Scandinavium lactucae]|uniref:SymE family type I addiction module toxin n=1 Tax=Scandinavium lactucae TaxID=3095028 RepID=A0ABU4QUS1_9ENTR|nr:MULTISPECIES: SymE family type I addiction module toxin [unclassified Scandinavium]MDX6043041.1 SymE family type I addiction module toxin [Scandinavium sp. V105_6]MDX6053042.1 SymE family type I addiction module toxin [Scandinavium sp. V105_1]
MAEHDCISEHGISKAQRRYILDYVPNRGNAGTPNIHLKGKWLKEAEFETGTHLIVKISDGCIVIIKDSEEANAPRNEKEALHQQLLDINQANQNINSTAK